MISFVNKHKDNICFKHAVLRITLRGEDIQFGDGWESVCIDCVVEAQQLAELNKIRKERIENGVVLGKKTKNP